MSIDLTDLNTVTGQRLNELKSSNHSFINQYWQLLRKELKEIFTIHPREWLDAFRPNPNYPFFGKGDIDGFIALLVNTLATLLAVILNLQPILGHHIVYGKIMPGVGLSMLWGNVYYCYMARKISFREQRGDVCAMPYGLNTPGAFAFIYVIILPTYYQCIKTNEIPYCQELAWHVALASNFLTAIILLVLCVFGEFIRKNVPSVALLSSISGLGFVYLALNEYIQVVEIPLVSFVPFIIIVLGFFGQVSFGPIPFALIALICGTALGWITSNNQLSNVREAAMLVQAYRPVFPIKGIFTHFSTIRDYLSTTVPTAISIAICTIQCVESTKRAGDFYPTREAMFADGIGTLIASLFGSIFGMTTYIGHSAFKKMGARQAYSLMHAVFYLCVCFFGINALLVSIISIVSIKPIVVCVGLIIFADTLAITPRRHYPALLMGIMSIVADWGQGTILNGINNAYSSFTIPNTEFSLNITREITGFSYRGLMNFAGGSQLQCIFVTAIMMYMIDRKFLHASFWSLLACVFSFFGLIHASSVGILIKSGDDGWRFTVSYAILSIIFGLMELAQRKQWIKEPETEPDDLSSPEWFKWNLAQCMKISTGVENPI